MIPLLKALADIDRENAATVELYGTDYLHRWLVQCRRDHQFWRDEHTIRQWISIAAPHQRRIQQRYDAQRLRALVDYRDALAAARPSEIRGITGRSFMLRIDAPYEARKLLVGERVLLRKWSHIYRQARVGRGLEDAQWTGDDLLCVVTGYGTAYGAGTAAVAFASPVAVEVI